MIEKCLRCGKELVEGIKQEPRPGSLPRTMSVLLCPIHGADHVWRPCVFAYREVKVKGRHSRTCRLQASLHCGAVYVRPDRCATCPVPALVEAVMLDAKAEIALGRATRMNHGPDRDLALEAAGRVRVDATLARDAALAALEEAKAKGESDG